MPTTRTLDVERSTSTAHRLSEYDGVCGCVHGHNIHWEVSVDVDMSDTGTDNMPLDLKDVSDLIDDVDHAIILSRDDQLLRFIYEHEDGYDHAELDEWNGDGPLMWSEDIAHLGETYIFDSDPTCEVLSQWMADRIRALDPVTGVEITVYETDKYGISTISGSPGFQG